MRSNPARALCAVLALAASFLVVLLGAASSASAGSLSHGSLTMVSTLADGTSGPTLPTTEGADNEAISDDGKVIAFTSPVPAQQLVTDPTQVGHVNDTNGVDDVFVWDSRVPAPVGPIVSLVSWNNTHTGTGDAASTDPIVAPLGIGVVFESGATDLTSVPVGAFSNHIYAWVPLISAVTPVFMVDENYQGTAGSDSISSDPSIAITTTPPMARVAFTSSGTDLVDPNQHKGSGAGQVYVRTYTLASPSTQMVSVATDGNGTASGADEPMISADAEHVVFASGGSDLLPNFVGTGGDIWVRNLLTDSTTLISGKAGSASVGTGGNNSPVISADGSSVAWESNASDLVPIPKNTNAHVYYRGLIGGIQLVDTDVTGLQGCDQFSNSPGLSLDGTMVDYEGDCTDSVTPITSSGAQVFARRMEPDPTVPALVDTHPVLVSVNDAGTAAGNGDSFLCPGNNPPKCGASSNPGITMNADGTAIAFMSQSSDIGTPPGGTPPFNGGSVYVRYPAGPTGGSTINLSLNAANQFSDGESRDPVMSADGGTVAFVSLADDFGMTDTNGATDVFTSDIKNTYTLDPITPVHEGDGHVTIGITRTGNLGTSDVVELKTGDGSTPDLPLLPPQITDPANSNATAPSDYTATDKKVTFAPGVTNMTVDVPIVDDNVAESAEIFHVSLSPVSGAVSALLPGPASEAYVVILDDDGDTTPPDVTVDQAAGQADPTSVSPIEFTATFSEPVTGFDGSDVDLSGSTAGGTLAATVTGGPSVYTIDVSGMTTDGSVKVSIPAGAAEAAASNPSTASTSSDNEVAWQAPPVDTTPPNVTVNQAAAQADPTSVSPIEFTATFSEPVTGFDTNDVDLSGSTAGGTLTAAITGGPTAYTIDVSGMTTAGTVKATIPAGAAEDAASNPSNASTSTDNTVTWQVALVGSSVAVTEAPSSVVFGQAAEAIATVTLTSGSAHGDVQFSVDGADVGTPVAVTAAGTATSAAMNGLAVGSHTVEGTFTPDDPSTVAGSNGSTTLVVDQAKSATSLTVQASSLHAAVSAVAPGGGTPTGKVTFSVDGHTVGTATLNGGGATLAYTTTAGTTRHVAVAYAGSVDFLASSDSRARQDPTIVARVNSAHPRTKYGWYRSSVQVSFTCATHGAPLTTRCPATVTLTHNGAAQSVSRTITAGDGGIATAAVTGLSIDTVAPKVKVTGVTAGRRYARPGPALHCVGSDALSGLASCAVRRTTVSHGDTNTVFYTAAATDRAGNSASVHGSFVTSNVVVDGASYSKGAYTVHRGRTYTLVIAGTRVRPVYYDAAPYAVTPFHKDVAFHAAGTRRWAVAVLMQLNLKSHLYWNIGIKVGATMHVIKIRAIA